MGHVQVSSSSRCHLLRPAYSTPPRRMQAQADRLEIEGKVLLSLRTRASSVQAMACGPRSR
eukprot:2611992-Pleurochrysis_carterae.AAC.1